MYIGARIKMDKVDKLAQVTGLFVYLLLTNPVMILILKRE